MCPNCPLGVRIEGVLRRICELSQNHHLIAAKYWTVCRRLFYAALPKQARELQGARAPKPVITHKKPVITHNTGHLTTFRLSATLFHGIVQRPAADEGLALTGLLLSSQKPGGANVAQRPVMAPGQTHDRGATDVAKPGGVASCRLGTNLPHFRLHR